MTSSQTQARPGDTIQITIGFSDATPGSGTAAFLWTAALPAGLVVQAVAGGQALTALGKEVDCDPTSLTCVGWGMNEIPVGPGQLATLSIPIPANQPPGPISISLARLSAGNASGQAVSIAIPAAVSIKILDRADLNGDGVVDKNDVLLALQQLFQPSTCSTADQNGDGVCDLTDVLVIIQKALGGG